MKLPTYCFDCGVVLQGGATEHKPDCVILRIIRNAFGEREEQAGEDTVPEEQ
jgi:hypothetical protein